MKNLLIPALILTSKVSGGDLFAKGLDKLQAETPSSETTPEEKKPEVTDQKEKIEPPKPDVKIQPIQKADSAKPEEQIPTPAVKDSPPQPAPLEPGLQKAYLATGFSVYNISAKSAGWHSAVGADIELGAKVAQINPKLSLFGTYRYLASDVTTNADQRAYRGIVETHNIGAKGHFSLHDRLLAFTSLELGLAQTHLTPSDGRIGTDKNLEKPGVELTLGGGVSYIVLDKIGVGARAALGTGAFNSVQLGVDLRFMF